MKISHYILLAALSVFSACGTTQNTAGVANKELIKEKNQVTITLINRIRQLPGVVIRSGVPVFTRTASEVQDARSFEPLYIINDYIVGNSFRSVNDLVQSADVKEIEAITGPETSFYGARGGNGVIKITTYK